MPAPPNVLSVPLTLLVATATTFVAVLLSEWLPSSVPNTLGMVASLVVSLALHLAWVLPAMQRRHGALTAAGWLVSSHLCAEAFGTVGLRPVGAAPALVIETAILALAVAHAPAMSWADRIARWRRSRERISTELRIGDGVVPWVLQTCARFVRGRADRPLSTNFDRIVAELAASEDRIRRTIARLSLPDAVRECLETSAHTITIDAETTFARMSIDLERRALDHAAGCRDAILHLDDLPESERERLARECESLMLELTHDIGILARPSAHFTSGCAS